MSIRTIGAWPSQDGFEFRAWAPSATEVRLLLQTSELWDAAREIIHSGLTRHDPDNMNA